MIAFWVVFGIKKLRWAKILAIVLTVLVVITGLLSFTPYIMGAITGRQIPFRGFPDGGDFNPSTTPIQSAVDNATRREVICVKDGTYTENVKVKKDHLTIQSENGAEVTIVQAAFQINGR